MRADAESLWPLLGHSDTRVRARAVAGFPALDVTDVRGWQAPAGGPRWSAEVVELLTRGGSCPGSAC
ncbi:hypothetical protein ACFYXF_16505 [Streptomyces sp. NPDC002680]|uniref:hypothetical protein n=1 Tax=Streptomyces sp. NPDC002680 TaxID=3364659 RepID=UPI0036997E6D